MSTKTKPKVGQTIKWEETKYGEIIAIEGSQCLIEYEDGSRNHIPTAILEEYIYEEQPLEGMTPEELQSITKGNISVG